VKPVGERSAGNPHAAFDERGWETGRCRMAQVTAPILDSTVSALPNEGSLKSGRLHWRRPGFGKIGTQKRHSLTWLIGYYVEADGGAGASGETRVRKNVYDFN
jgi:hypothetical protein